jgi:hypothetical protein
MITTIVRYRLPSHIGEAECRAHYERIAPGFGETPGLLRKQFIWSERGIAGGVYQWTDIALWFPKIPSGRIRTVRQNQRIIAFDAHDPPLACSVFRQLVQVAASA